MNTSKFFRRVTIPLAVAISLSLTSNIYAVRVVGSVSGEVILVRGGVVPDGVDVGDPFSANFSYDSDALVVSDCDPDYCDTIVGYGEGLNLEMSFVIDSQSDGVYEWQGESPTVGVTIWNELPVRDFGGSFVGYLDRLYYALFSGSGSFTSFPNAPPDPYSKKIDLEFIGGGPFITSLSLPVSIEDLNVQHSVAQILADARPSSYRIDAGLDLSTFSLAPVPEPTTSADFDGDGDVDNDDLTHPTLGWETRFGVDLDGMNFLDWQGEFGTGVTPLLAAQATPEPSSLLLALAAIVMLTQTWRSRG